MRKTVFTALAAGLLVAATLLPNPPELQAQTKKPAPVLKVGDPAPDFHLKYFDGTDLKDVSLSQYRDKKNVVLAFYIFAFDMSAMLAAIVVVACVVLTFVPMRWAHPMRRLR